MNVAYSNSTKAKCCEPTYRTSVIRSIIQMSLFDHKVWARSYKIHGYFGLLFVLDKIITFVGLVAWIWALVWVEAVAGWWEQVFVWLLHFLAHCMIVFDGIFVLIPIHKVGPLRRLNRTSDIQDLVRTDENCIQIVLAILPIYIRPVLMVIFAYLSDPWSSFNHSELNQVTQFRLHWRYLTLVKAWELVRRIEFVR